jgi:DNA-binding response OmpR family regulator
MKPSVKILIAEDDRVSRFMLEATLKKWGYDAVVAEDGRSALAAMKVVDPPALAILDWMMPEMDGLEVTRVIRKWPLATAKLYIILLTAKNEKPDVVKALEAGADDYLTKPFHADELRARVQVGLRIVELQSQLTARVRDLENALATVKQLQGMLPICSYCKKIRDDQNYWQSVEDYISTYSEAQFSHGICPDCFETNVKPQLLTLKRPRTQHEYPSRESSSLPDCG